MIENGAHCISNGIYATDAHNRERSTTFDAISNQTYDEGDSLFESIASTPVSVSYHLGSSALELMNSNSFQHASSKNLFNLIYRIIDESFEKQNCHVRHMAHIITRVVHIIEQRISALAENLNDANNINRLSAGRSQSRVRALETLAAGSTKEIEVLLSQLKLIKDAKSELEEKAKLEELDILRLKEEKDKSDCNNSALKMELQMCQHMYEENMLIQRVQSEETKLDLEKKIKELDFLLTESTNRSKELESLTESISHRWRQKEGNYQTFINSCCTALQEIMAASKCLSHEVFEAKQTFSEQFASLGAYIHGLAESAKNHQAVLAENRRLYNEVQDLRGNIRVYCRIRPFFPDQCKKNTTIEYIGENGELVITNPMKQGKDSHKFFKFYKVFGPAATQEDVFLDTQPLIRSVLDGYNVCIFAYGQTGSGKTYTMTGPTLSSEDDWGVNYRALRDLFHISQSRKSSISYEVGVQMVEIYNEQVRDLLLSGGSQRRLGIWNKALPNGLAVPDASMLSVTSTSDVLELMNIGLTNRTVGATAINERSSRSHSVLTVHVRGTVLETGSVLCGSLHLVDLAGSERVDRSEATGERLREAQHINKSLSALGDVIFALAQKSSYVPYRNSKLTQLLQSSLGGQAKTLMFVQLNPDEESYSETISTLKFAERVSGVELGAAKSNKEGKDIRELMEQLASCKEVIAKKDEEIRRLQLLVSNHSKQGTNMPKFKSSSFGKNPVGFPRSNSKVSIGGGSTTREPPSDVDNSSVYSELHSEGGSHHSTDDLRLSNRTMAHSKSTADIGAQNDTLTPTKSTELDPCGGSKEDIDLLGFENADSDGRLSDISDGGLSMGTETDGSLGSAVEFTLFAEYAKQSENASPPVTLKPIEASNSADSAKPPKKDDGGERSGCSSKIPKLPHRGAQSSVSRVPVPRNSTPKVQRESASVSKRSNTVGSSSSAKPLKRWH